MPDGHTVGFRTDTTQLVRTSEPAEAACKCKSQFLGNRSHKIRTPMNAIQGMRDGRFALAFSQHRERAPASARRHNCGA